VFTALSACAMRKFLHPLPWDHYGITMTNDGFLRPSDNTPFTDSGSLPMAGLARNDGVKIPKRRVWAWALWDWATQPFASVITTFVFTVYVTSSIFLPDGIRELSAGDPTYDRAMSILSRDLGYAIALAGLLVALLAPVFGQRSDRLGRRKLWLGINTGLIVIVQALMFFVEAAPSFFWLGVTLVAAGNVFADIANVNYNAMLVQVANPRTVGKVSGLGWGLGYMGGIIALLVSYFGFIEGDILGIGSDNGLDIRSIAVFCAVWTIIFSLPILIFVPEIPKSTTEKKVNFLASYRILASDVKKLSRESPTTFWFLISSAVFRDGLAGVFTFGGVIAAVTFGFSPADVLIFGIAANLGGGVSTMIAGPLDDRFGPKRVIIFSLVGLLVAGMSLFFLRDAGTIPFWIAGMFLSLFTGPVQAASRSFLARVTPAGQEGQIFGLYATTGRAVSFITPTLWSLAIAIGGAQYWGILGIMLVLLVGLILMMFVKMPQAPVRA
jgi:MFS transporter, UMF1 family